MYIYIQNAFFSLIIYNLRFGHTNELYVCLYVTEAEEEEEEKQFRTNRMNK